jgi:hypothetical protein
MEAAMLRLHRTRLATLLVAVAVCSTVGCTGATEIGQLLSQPEGYDGEEVKIRGTVTSAVRLPLVDIRIYNVQDGTGEVVVLTSGPLPSRGDRVSVKGIFSTLGTVNGRSLGPHIRAEGAE